MACGFESRPGHQYLRGIESDGPFCGSALYANSMSIKNFGLLCRRRSSVALGRFVKALSDAKTAKIDETDDGLVEVT